MNFNILEAATPAQLFALYADIVAELRQRGIARNNNLVAEYLIATALDLDLATNSTKGYDATSKDGTTHYQVKGRWLAGANPSRQLGAIRDLHDQHFAYLAGVLFAADFSIAKACLIPAAVVEREAKYIAHTNSWMLHLRDGLWLQEGVRDITEAVRAAAMGEALGENVVGVPSAAPEVIAVATADATGTGIAAPAISDPVNTTKTKAVTEPKVTYTFSRFCFKADYIGPLTMTDAFRMVTTHHGTFQMTKEEFYRDFPTVRFTKSYRENRLHHSPTVSRNAARYRISA